jgi:hypothetical protein
MPTTLRASVGKEARRRTTLSSVSLQHQPSGKACRWPAAKCKPEMVDDALKSRRSPRSLRHDAMLKAFSKNLSSAEWRLAHKTPRRKAKLNPATGTRQVGNGPDIAAVDAS